MTQIPDCHQPSARGERGDVKEQRAAAVAERQRVAQPQRRQKKEKKVEEEEEDRARQMERNEVTAIFTRGTVNLQGHASPGSSQTIPAPQRQKHNSKAFISLCKPKSFLFLFVRLHLSATFRQNRTFCCTFLATVCLLLFRGKKKNCVPPVRKLKIKLQKT